MITRLLVNIGRSHLDASKGQHVTMFSWRNKKHNVQSLYNTPHYNTDLDKQSHCGSQIILPGKFTKEMVIFL